MARRTRNSFGTIQSKKLKRGVRHYPRYTGPDGREHTSGGGFTRRADANAWLAAENRLMQLDAWTPPEQRRKEAVAQAQAEKQRGMTVAELVEHWLENSRSIKRESTRRSHRKRLELRVLCDSIPGRFTSLKDMRVVDVDKATIEKWARQCEKVWPDNTSTTFYAHKRLVTAFNWAINELGLIESNPVQLVRLDKPRPANADEPVFTQSEAEAIEAAFPLWLEHAPAILLWCGLRVGEALELRVKDITGVEPGAPMVFQIRREMTEVDGLDGGKETLINDMPKTEAGVRDVTVPAWVADKVRAHLEKYGKLGNPEALVISRKNGNQFTQNNFRCNYFDPAKSAAGRRHNSSVHSCRRFYGTALIRLVIAGSLSLEEARRLIGHETTEQLMDYMRAEVGYQQRAAEALNAMRPGTLRLVKSA